MIIIKHNYTYRLPTVESRRRARQVTNNQSLAKKVERRRMLRQWRKEEAGA